ncbi:ATP-binding protein [Streptomyces sp. NPDC005931]|uniref:ATP-binding protein n=1 Tax=Streptomyces sp. NPDC005931 TaxID=3364737 RepID=UPI0036A4E703
MALPAETRRVCSVRRFLSHLLNSWGVIESDRDTAGLIVSELAGNAALHGGAQMTVRVSLSARLLRIDVVDTGPATSPPPSRAEDSADEHGRGLGIVDHLAEWIDIQAEPDSWRSSAGLRVSSTTQMRSAPQAA